jgi:fructoselysine 6-kinase
MIRIIGVGDNTVDRYLHLGMMFPGGNAVNVPVLAHRYGHPASYIGWLGDDARGHLILDALNEEGVDTSRCRIIDGPNAYSEVTLVEGDRVFVGSDPGVTVQIALSDEDLDFVREHDVAHTSIYSHIEQDLPRLSEASPCLSFDFSQDWDRAYLAGVLPWVDVAFLSHPGQSHRATAELMRWMRSRGPEIVVVTRGGEDAMAYDGRRVYRQGVIETDVVDTLGAGDAFAARFLVEHLDGTSIADALAAAAESAAEACGHYGAFGHGVVLTQGRENHHKRKE